MILFWVGIRLFLMDLNTNLFNLLCLVRTNTKIFVRIVGIVTFRNVLKAICYNFLFIKCFDQSNDSLLIPRCVFIEDGSAFRY